MLQEQKDQNCSFSSLFYILFCCAYFEHIFLVARNLEVEEIRLLDKLIVKYVWPSVVDVWNEAHGERKAKQGRVRGCTLADGREK